MNGKKESERMSLKNKLIFNKGKGNYLHGKILGCFINIFFFKGK